MEQKSYEAAAFVPDGRRLAGSISLTAVAVQFRSAEGDADLPLEGIIVRAGGASDRLIFFEHAAVPGTSMHTSDRSVLQDPALAAHSSQLRVIRKAAQNRLLITLAILATIVGLIAGLIAARGLMVAAVARRVPAGVEKKIGELAMRQMLLTAKVESDPAVVAPMQQILTAVKAGVKSKEYEFTLVVIDDDAVNAFALPGGSVAIHTGLIEKAKNADEIAGVLGHEIAHVTEQHSLRQIISSIGLFAIVQAVFGDISGVIAVAAESSAQLLVLQFSRDAERDADAQGMAILQRAGVDPGGMASFFTTLKNSEGAAGAIPAFLSTHPATEDRIAELRNRLAEVNRSSLRSLPIDLTAAKRALAAR